MKIKINLCLTSIPKDKIFVSEKTNKKYLNIEVIELKEPDRFGNQYAVAVEQTKQERETKQKGIWIGSGKLVTPKVVNAPVSDDDDNDLPF